MTIGVETDGDARCVDSSGEFASLLRHPGRSDLDGLCSASKNPHFLLTHLGPRRVPVPTQPGLVSRNVNRSPLSPALDTNPLHRRRPGLDGRTPID